MRSHSRVVLGLVIGIGTLMILILGFHVGGTELFAVGNFSPLVGALIGGALILICVNLPQHQTENGGSWLTQERLAWGLIGCGCIAWAIGESFWRYYRALGQNPFPSLADFGYASFPPLVLAGLILQPSVRNDQRREFVLLDSLIATGALLSIAWFLLLGPLAQTPVESMFAKALGLYYPTMDTLLLSCTVFLLLRESDDASSASARRISLLIAGIGLWVFASSDFIFNVQENLGTYMEGTWIDLGWPLGMMAMGVAAYLRRFLPVSPAKSFEQVLKRRTRLLPFGPAQALPYLLLVVLLCVMTFNVLSSNSIQQSIRPVLVGATMIVVGLVLARQLFTLRDNAQLVLKQTATLQELGRVNQSIVERNALLEAGITHLKEIQTRLANGDVRARARLMDGELWPLATCLNLMADRMMRLERSQSYAQQIAKAVEDLNQVLEHKRNEMPMVIPASCLHLPELHHLLLALGMKSPSGPTQPTQYPTQPTPPRPRSSPLIPITDTPANTLPHQPFTSPEKRWRESIKHRPDGSGTP
ncbi:MAG: hypothetical protein JO215_01245 [Ktedonobacteraceae bacterium]|nr:hypothetical protein [Ktedonobacteraceae bacterium]